MKKLTRRTFVTGSAAVLCAPSVKTEAQSAWPARPIRIIVPYPAGGQTDGIARAFGDYLARQLGKTVIVENKAGAGGVIGVTEAKRAEPDGTTILCTISSSLIQNRLTVKDLPYDPEKDFIYLTMVSGAGGPVVAAKKTGATNLREFIEYGKKVGSLNWGSYGVGSTPHVLIATIAKQYGIQVSGHPVPRRGADVERHRGADAGWRRGKLCRGSTRDSGGNRKPDRRGRQPPAALSGHADHDRTGRRRRLLRPARLHRLRGTDRHARDIVDRLAQLLIQAGSDAKVQQMLNNFILSSPADLETTARIFKRDSDVMLRILRDLGVKPRGVIAERLIGRTPPAW